MSELQIIFKPIAEVKPYGNNPRRHNNKSVDVLAESIKSFGFKSPIIIDTDGVIVNGHGRYLAAKKLGLDEVPCVLADDLTPEQIREYRLVDNKTSDLSTFDKRKFVAEKKALPSFNASKFGFKPAEYSTRKELGAFGDERERTFRAYNLIEFDPEDTAGRWQMPCIHKSGYVPTELVGFNYMLTTQKRCGVHFFIDDYQFERIWNSPYDYIGKLTSFEGALTPDFSLYMDMPMAMKLWNVYRSRLIGQLMQRAGIPVCPTISWAEPETFSFCFDGIEKGSTVAISTIGVKEDKTALGIWRAGMDEMIERIEPTAIIVYGGKLEYDYRGIPVKYFDNVVTERMKKSKEKNC